jgi:hypothetical protein
LDDSVFLRDRSDEVKQKEARKISTDGLPMPLEPPELL